MKNFFQMGRNLLLPLLVNLLVMVMLGVLFQAALHFFPGLQRHSNMLWMLGGISLVLGMGGSFVSLLLSRWVAKQFGGVQVVDPDTNQPELRELVQMVHGYAKRANLPQMPEVGIYESPEVNAFATGPSKSSSLVAVSTGMLRQMNRPEVEGVIAHEVAHIANGDMVTMTLLQGVLNAFVFFFAHLLGFLVAQALRGRSDDRDRGGFGDYLIQSILIHLFQFLFGALAMFVVCWFSRRREFRADAGSMLLAGKDRMISALRGLQRIQGQPISLKEASGNFGFEALKISGHPSGFMALFSTHPPLEERIAHLESLGR